MAPQRARAQDDARSELSTGKERHATTHAAGVNKTKRPAGANSAAAATAHKDARPSLHTEAAAAVALDVSTGHGGGVHPLPCIRRQSINTDALLHR